MRFELGRLVVTRGIEDGIDEDLKFRREVMASISRHSCGDWGDICEDDKRENDYALLEDERLLSVYETSKGKIWIITERDRSVTTVLFPCEY